MQGLSHLAPAFFIYICQKNGFYNTSVNQRFTKQIEKLTKKHLTYC